MNEVTTYPGDDSSIFTVLILHFENLEGVRMLLHVTTEEQLATTRKIFSSAFRQNMTDLERTKEEQTKTIRSSPFSVRARIIVNLEKQQKKHISKSSSS